VGRVFISYSCKDHELVEKLMTLTEPATHEAEVVATGKSLQSFTAEKQEKLRLE